MLALFVTNSLTPGINTLMPHAWHIDVTGLIAALPDRCHGNADSY
jgi:hypothetical protein